MSKNERINIFQSTNQITRGPECKQLQYRHSCRCWDVEPLADYVGVPCSHIGSGERGTEFWRMAVGLEDEF